MMLEVAIPWFVLLCILDYHLTYKLEGIYEGRTIYIYKAKESGHWNRSDLCNHNKQEHIINRLPSQVILTDKGAL